MTEQDYDEAMHTHFWAPLYTMTAALPVMRGRGGGRIVNIASIGGKVAVPHLVPYSASKFALVGLSQAADGGAAQGQHLRHDRLPGADPHRQPAQRAVQGPAHAKEYAWFALGDALPGISQSADRAAAADRQRLPLRRAGADHRRCPRRWRRGSTR